MTTMTPNEKLKLKTSWEKLLKAKTFENFSKMARDVAEDDDQMKASLLLFSQGVSAVDDVVNYLTDNWAEKNDA